MKILFILFCFSLSFWACLDLTKEYVNSDNKKDSNFQINTDMPFGCYRLKTLKYPKSYESEPGSDGILKQPEGKEFEDIGECFQSINLAKTIKHPEVERLEHLNIGDNYNNAYGIDTLLQKSFDSCRYRLPNIGIYECYYSYQQDTKPNSFGIYGNLLLLNPRTKNGKLLNIYFEGSGDASLIFRYFFIDKNDINIYEGFCYDDGCSLDEKFKISINQEGGIEINRIQR